MDRFALLVPESIGHHRIDNHRSITTALITTRDAAASLATGMRRSTPLSAGYVVYVKPVAYGDKVPYGDASGCHRFVIWRYTSGHGIRTTHFMHLSPSEDQLMAKRVTIAATVCTAALVAASFTTAIADGHFNKAPAKPELTALKQESVKVPTAAEVKAAKVDPKTKKTLKERIQSELDKTAENYRKINERSKASLAALGEIQQAALTRKYQLAEATRQAKAAEAKLVSSRNQMGQIASQIYKNRASSQGGSLLLSKDAQSSLDRAETDQRIASSRNRDLKAAEADKNLASQHEKYVSAVKKEADKAAAAEAEAKKVQREQAAKAKAAQEEQDSNRAKLYSRMATLDGTSVKSVKSADEARQAKIQEELDRKAREEAKRQAQEEATAKQVAAFKAERAKQTEIKGIKKPADVVPANDSSDGAQEEGASSDANKADQDAAAKKAADEKAAQDKADKEAAEKAAKEQAEKDAAAKKAADEKAAAEQAAKDAAAKKEAADKAAERNKADQEAAAQKAAADKAAAEKAAAQRAAAKKAAAQKAAAQRAAAQRAAAQKAAAQRAAAQRAAAQRAAAQRAAAQKAAAQRAAAQKAAAQRAAAQKASQASSATGANIVATGKRYIGTPYVWGQASPSGWDCLGFVSYVFKQNGYNIDNSYASVLSAGRTVPYSQAQPGDILYWPGHVAISLGGGQNVGAWNPGMGTRIGPDSWIGGTPTVIRVF
jgi:cell wall-associated NlpC family hydrolase